MYFIGLTQIRGTRDDDVSVGVFLAHFLAKMFLHTTQFIRLNKVAIRQGFQAIFIARNPHKLFDITVPRRDVLIANRPIYRKSIALRTCKIKITPALRMSSPQERTTAHVIGLNPIVGLVLDIRLLPIFGQKMSRSFSENKVLTCGFVFLFLL